MSAQMALFVNMGNVFLIMNNEIIPEVKIYQIRVYIRQISPLIWRRFLVRSDSTIADLHHTLQLVFGWGNFHLHQFLIRGKSYGIAYAGGISFSDNPHKVTLEQFNFGSNERFVYEYNFNVGWELEVRVEKTFPLNPKKIYPVCIGGEKTSPNEDCDGPLAYMELRKSHSIFMIEDRIVDILTDEELTNEEKIEECQYQAGTLFYWSNREEYNRIKINERLKRFAIKEKNWEEPFEEVF